MRSGVPLSMEVRTQIRQMVRAGHTVIEIASTLGIGTTSVTREKQRMRAGYLPHQVPAALKDDRRALSPAQVEQLRRRRREGATWSDLAREFGLSRASAQERYARDYQEPRPAMLTRHQERRRERDGQVAAKYMVTLGGVMAGFSYLEDQEDALDRAYHDVEDETWREVEIGTALLARLTRRVRMRREFRVVQGEEAEGGGND